MRRLRVFLDANILFSARLRDLFLGFAEYEVIDVFWSDEVLEELQRTLQARGKVTATNAQRLVDALGSAFRLARIEWDTSLSNLYALPDPDDRHVLAAAIAGECDLLITDNIADFPEEDIPSSAEIAVFNAGEAIQLLAGQGHQNVAPIIDSIVRRYKTPPMTPRQFIDGIRNISPLGGQALGAATGDQDDILAIATTMDALTSGSPQWVVIEICHHLRDNTGYDLSEYSSSDLVSQANESNMRVDDYLRAILSEVLAEPEGTWSVGSLPRPTSPLQSLVKLFRMEPEMSEVITHPTEVYAYMCWLVYEEDSWRLDRVGGEDPAISEARQAKTADPSSEPSWRIPPGQDL